MKLLDFPENKVMRVFLFLIDIRRDVVRCLECHFGGWIIYDHKIFIICTQKKFRVANCDWNNTKVGSKTPQWVLTVIFLGWIRSETWDMTTNKSKSYFLASVHDLSHTRVDFPEFQKKVKVLKSFSMTFLCVWNV